MTTLRDVFQGAASQETNYVQYSIFLPSKSDDKEIIRSLQDHLAKIHSIVQPIVNDYIWQKDRFALSIAREQSNDPPYPFLHGVTRFGDCINDEWFVIYLLYQISISLPDAVITVSDNDGEVLLIEAAMELPSWLDPSNSQNRVYLYKGEVHIIPLASSPADILQMPEGSSTTLRRERAIDMIRHPPSFVKTVAGPGIQKAINDRIACYPKAAQDETHRARCLLPKHAAYVVLREPQLLPLAVEAFYLRDPVSLKACAAMRKFSPVANVEATVRFTKTTYAQLVSQKFYAPKPFRLPPVSRKKEYQIAELGMKLACGLEMLYNDDQCQERVDSSIDPEQYMFDKDPKYKDYITRLLRLGYFRGERPGSRLYRELEHQAKVQYLRQQKEVAVSISDDTLDKEETLLMSGYVFGSLSPRQKIDALLAEYTEEGLQELLNSNQGAEDSDEWMNVDPQQLEELLMQRMGQMNNKMMQDMAKDIFGSDDAGGQEPAVDLEKIMSNFEQFVEGSKSGIEGVEFPGESNDTDEDDSDEGEEDEDADISFDTERFMSILDETLEGGYDRPKDAERNPATVSEKPANELSEFMRQMDQEVYSHEKVSGSFTKHGDSAEEDKTAPVDIELNLVKNVLESYKSQQGLPGPVGNILGQFGIVLPADADDENDKS